MIRSRLEGLAARLATRRITKEQIDEMEEMILLSEFYLKKGMTEQLSNLDGKFHFILYEACGSRMLKNVLTDFHRYVQMARRMSVKWRTGRRNRFRNTPGSCLQSGQG